jgi:phage terminase small subunit
MYELSSGEQDRLSLREERFCLAVANTGDKYKAFDIAGYEARTKGARAACVSRLLKRPRIKKRIDELQKEYCLALGVTKERILANFAEIAFDKENNKSDRNRALEMLGRHVGFFEADNQQKGDKTLIVSDEQRMEQLENELALLKRAKSVGSAICLG